MSCCHCCPRPDPSAPPRNTGQLHLGELNPLAEELLQAIWDARTPADPHVFRKIPITIGSQTWLLQPHVDQSTIFAGSETVATFYIRAPNRGEEV